MSRRVVVLATSIVGPGGIQRFNRLFARALAEVCREQRAEMDVLVLTDQHPIAPDIVPGARLLRGFGGDRVSFGRAAAVAPFGADLAIVGHANLLPLVLPVALTRYRRRPRLALVVHGVDAWDPWAWPHRQAARRMDRLISVSQYTADRCVAANRLSHVQAVIVPNALDPAFEPSTLDQPPAEPGDLSQIVSITRLGYGDEGKGIDTVLRAMPLVLERCPAARYIVVGDGALVAGLRQLAEREGVTAAVDFRGSVSEAELMRIQQASSIFVLPSRLEGFGLVFLEAMAFGRPVVAARAGAAGEVVCDGTTGLLVPYDDPPALADALARLLLDADLRRRLGLGGRARVRELYTYGHLVERLRALVGELLVERP